MKIICAVDELWVMAKCGETMGFSGLATGASAVKRPSSPTFVDAAYLPKALRSQRWSGHENHLCG
jgi:hypothetical protein